MGWAGNGSGAPPPKELRLRLHCAHCTRRGQGLRAGQGSTTRGSCRPPFFLIVFFFWVGLHCADIAQVNAHKVRNILISAIVDDDNNIADVPAQCTTHRRLGGVNGHDQRPSLGGFRQTSKRGSWLPSCLHPGALACPPASIDRHPHLLAQARRLRRSNLGYTRPTVAATPCPGARCLATINEAARDMCRDI